MWPLSTTAGKKNIRITVAGGGGGGGGEQGGESKPERKKIVFSEGHNCTDGCEGALVASAFPVVLFAFQMLGDQSQETTRWR